MYCFFLITPAKMGKSSSSNLLVQFIELSTYLQVPIKYLRVPNARLSPRVQRPDSIRRLRNKSLSLSRPRVPLEHWIASSRGTSFRLDRLDGLLMNLR